MITYWLLGSSSRLQHQHSGSAGHVSAGGGRRTAAGSVRNRRMGTAAARSQQQQDFDLIQVPSK